MADVSASENGHGGAVWQKDAATPSVRAMREALWVLRRPIDDLCAVGLARLSEPEYQDRVIAQAELVSRAAGALSEAFLASCARVGSDDERARRKRTAQELADLAAQVTSFEKLALGERQRLVALGMRLCAAVSMHLPAQTEKPSKSLVSVPMGRRSEPGPVPSENPARAVSAASSVPSARPASGNDLSDGVSDAFTSPEQTAPLDRPLLGMPGVGKVTAEKLQAKGLCRVFDALYLLPKRYDDLRQVVAVGALEPGVLQTTVVLVERTRVVWARKRFLEATFRGEDGAILVARWFYFHGGYQKRLLPGKRFLLTATPVQFRGVMQATHPELTELAPVQDADCPRFADGTGQIRARYPDVEGVPAKTVERLCQYLCAHYAEFVPDGIPNMLLTKLGFPSLSQTLRDLHLVSSDATTAYLSRLNAGLSPAQRRLIFEELFFLQLGLLQRRKNLSRENAPVCRAGDGVLAKLRAVLPFVPTGAQERAMAEIARDLAQPHPMQRLLHGDVGSGKTLVAWAACECVAESGHQAAFMAPTEILAEQHYKTLRVWAKATGRKLALLTATTPKNARKTTLAQLQAGRFGEVFRVAETMEQPLDRETILAMLAAGFLDVVVGTHALIAEKVEFRDLALVIIDEQHRFGVHQRAALRKKGLEPHILVMTATPIPRTLALTLYGDLDVSQLDELPKGRTPPVTKVVFGKKGERDAIKAIRKTVSVGQQAYWVCPLIEESEKLDLASATARHVALCETLSDLRVGLVHGRLNTDERDQVMEAFRKNEIDVLVATTVIEVGVDVPNASLMVIESAERFGLSQLHQLRGRIGRGNNASLCLLLRGSTTSKGGAASVEPNDDVAGLSELEMEDENETKSSGPSGEPARVATGGQKDVLPSAGHRLAAVASTTDGFRLAEMDLRFRGPGEVLGTRQSGLPPLRFADLLRDIDLLTIARREAASLLSRDPDLSFPEHEVTRRVLSETWQTCDLRLE